MSCTDKIALWSFIGVQDTLLTSLVEPIYIHSIVLSDVGIKRREAVKLECTQAFHARFPDFPLRLCSILPLHVFYKITYTVYIALESHYRTPKMSINFTDMKFEHSKTVQKHDDTALVPSADGNS